MTKCNSLKLQSFYPKTMKIMNEIVSEDLIQLNIKSITHKAVCPVCHKIATNYHSTYHRRVHDLPILGKHVILDVTAYRYYCDNSECNQKIFAEDLQGFAGWYRRKTDRLEDLITTIALSTSCEGCARICKFMGIEVSGDTIIRLIIKDFVNHDVCCSEIVGVDDWAYKKGRTYGTIICDGKTHRPVELLDGRDGKELREWLMNNKHIKMVTRDRASAYAKVISEVLPYAMQIADRFHLHQNLLNAINYALSRDLPNKIAITGSPQDNYPVEFESKRFENKKKRIN
jgi:transposase